MFPELRCCPPLRYLSLQNCCNMPNANVWLAAVSPTLGELCCEPIDERMLLVLAEHCGSLRKFRCSLHPTVTAVSMEYLCFMNPQLI